MTYASDTKLEKIYVYETQDKSIILILTIDTVHST